mmetsp:Transcript_7939/g.13885  ORF Transcript_7939/g.13885 Transcript_7939/m.13885 type:complete len:147 (-) Transcript_7939:33-473(-)
MIGDDVTGDKACYNDQHGHCSSNNDCSIDDCGLEESRFGLVTEDGFPGDISAHGSQLLYGSVTGVLIRNPEEVCSPTNEQVAGHLFMLRVMLKSDWRHVRARVSKARTELFLRERWPIGLPFWREEDDESDEDDLDDEPVSSQASP